MSRQESKQRQPRPFSQIRLRWLYAFLAVGLTVTTASDFFDSMHWQLLLSQARAGALSVTPRWSAPLDDVFIHFDFARSTARGFPFQWSEGNGYSSGGTSLLYPFVLALGYMAGYSGTSLMHWAGMLACVSVTAALLAVRPMVSGLNRWTCLVFPPALLSVGALNWSLFSGMEVAFFLALWAVAYRSWEALLASQAAGQELRYAAVHGAAGMVMVACRPESAVLVACFTLSALGLLWSNNPGTRGKLRLLVILALGAIPGAVVVVGQAVANKLLTGDFSAAGALVKLEMNDPRLSAEQVWDAWTFHLRYQILRVTNYHFSDLALPLGGVLEEGLSAGWVVWALGLLATADRRTRRVSLLLWCSVWLFMMVVALNGQVRWQNERYTMPTVAWLLLNAGLGVAVAFDWAAALVARGWRREDSGRWAATVAALTGTALFLVGQQSRASDQRWFFGRASRNIHDQHIQVGRRLARRGAPKRVLVGDAGAIPYIADIPAFDIIGLGGYAGLPVAKASRWGVAASLELLQRMPPGERPDLLALYPSWWGDFPAWFGARRWEMPVRGNVICGGASKVVYRPDWSPMAEAPLPAQLGRRQKMRAQLDVGDLLSEEAAQMQLTGAVGHVVMRLLPRPGQPSRDLWDAGRLLPAGSSTSWRPQGLLIHEPAQLVLRVVQSQPAKVVVHAGGQRQEHLIQPGDGWQELTLPIAAASVRPGTVFTFEVVEGEVQLFNLWLVQQR